MTATTFILTVLSPLLVALVAKKDWEPIVKELLAVLVVVLCYVGGQALDGVLSYPLSQSFWVGLAAAFGLQQGVYKFLLKGTDAVKQLESVRE